MGTTIVKYYGGVQKGEGIWRIEQAGDSARIEDTKRACNTERKGDTETILTYSINLVPVGFILRLLSYFMNFSKIHSKQMKLVLENLNQYLTENGF